MTAQIYDEDGRLFLIDKNERQGAMTYFDREGNLWRQARGGVIKECKRCGKPAKTDRAYVHFEDPNHVKCSECVVTLDSAIE